MPESNESAAAPLLDASDKSDQPINQPINQSINQSINHSVNSYVAPSSHYEQSTDQTHNTITFPTYQPNDESTYQQPHTSIQMDQQFNQPLDQSTNQYSLNDHSSQPVYQPLYQMAPHLRHLIRERQLPPYAEPLSLSDLWSNFLSRGTKFFLLLIVVLWIAMFFLNSLRLVAAFIPFLFVPAGVFAGLVAQRFMKHVEVNLLFHQFIMGFSVLALATLLIETLLTIVFACVTILPFHFDEVKAWFNEQVEAAQNGGSTSPEDLFQGFSLSPAFFIFLFFISFCVAGCVEEGAKGWLGLRIKKITPGYCDKNGFLVYLVAGALGFSTFENIAYATAVTTPALSVFVNVLTRAFISTPLHLCCTYLVGVGIVRRDVFGQSVNWLRVFALPVLIHGGFDFALMICAAVMDPEETTAIVAEFVIVVLTFVLIGVTIHLERKHIAGEPPILPMYAAVDTYHAEPTHQPAFSSTQLAPM